MRKQNGANDTANRVLQILAYCLTGAYVHRLMKGDGREVLLWKRDDVR